VADAREAAGHGRRNTLTKEIPNMRKTVVALVLVVAVAVSARPARAVDAGEEVLFAGVAAAANVFYVPAKVALAGLGLPVGALVGALTGGNTRAAYAVWVPTIGGKYFLTPDQMAGKTDVEFIGSDYADRPSDYWGTHHGTVMYDTVSRRR
jgi:hypothetical protein